MFTLLVKNVDGSYVTGGWARKPTKKELAYEIGGMWNDIQETVIIAELLNTGTYSVEDSACTVYELSEV